MPQSQPVQGLRAEELGQPASRAASGGQFWLVFALTLLLAGGWTLSGLKRGWRPHDDGLLAQSAERVVAGELPHRDFDDPYSGALSFLNAVAFRIFGESLAAPRALLFIFFVPSLWASYYIASRFASPWAAGAITLLAAAWGVPNYPAAMPSWYNLFFALYGIVALLRFLETERRQWVFVAGLCAGFSITFKISGLYFVAAALLFFVAREQMRSEGAPDKTRSPAYSAVVVASLLLFVLAVLRLLTSGGSSAFLVHLFVAPAAIALALAIAELQHRGATSSERFAALFGDVIPFAGGVCLPILLLLAPYIASGSTAALLRDVFVTSLRRTESALQPPVPPHVILYSLPPLALLALGARWRNRRSAPLAALLGLAMLAVLASPLRVPGMWARIWLSLGASLPLAVPLGVLLLGKAKAPPRVRLAAFLLLAAAAVCSLIQFPYAAPVYFLYVAPLVLLAVFAVATLFPVQPAIPWLLGAFYLLFAIGYDSPMFIQLARPLRYPDRLTYALPGPRAGGIRVAHDEARTYEQLLPLIETHAGPSPYIYAGPDAPEVYFLSGKRNPTRVLFEFLSDVSPTDVIAALESRQVHVAVIRNDPEFSRLSPELRAYLVRAFPNVASAGRFQVRWHD